AENMKTAGVDLLGVVSVIGLVFVKHVTERVPMRCALYTQHQRLVCVPELVPVLPPSNSVGAGREHLVDRIETATEQSILRTGRIERYAQSEHLAGTDQARRTDDILRL